jgi:hypothetical protein
MTDHQLEWLSFSLTIAAIQLGIFIGWLGS